MISTLGSNANYCFRLQHPFTILILLLFSFVIACELFLGHSFSCTTDASVTSSYVDAGCYANALYTVPSAWRKTEGNEQSLSHITTSNKNTTDRWRIEYYRWVHLVLLVQAFIFYLPHLLWSTHEKGFISKLTSNSRYQSSASLLLLEEKRYLNSLANFLVGTVGKYSSYAFVHACCELLNHLASVVNMLWLVSFFKVTGVPDEIEDTVTLETWDDFAVFYFPPFAKCSLPHLQKDVSTRMETICSLPLNSIYVYMFLFLFAWYIFLAVFSGISIIMIFLKCCCHSVRRFLLKASLNNKQSATAIAHLTSYPDFFVLDQIKKNLLPGQFESLIKEMDRLLATKDFIE